MCVSVPFVIYLFALCVLPDIIATLLYQRRAMQQYSTLASKCVIKLLLLFVCLVCKIALVANSVTVVGKSKEYLSIRKNSFMHKAQVLLFLYQSSISFGALQMGGEGHHTRGIFASQYLARCRTYIYYAQCSFQTTLYLYCVVTYCAYHSFL